MNDPKTKKFLRGISNKDRAYELQTIRTILEADAALRLDLATYEAEVYRLLSSGSHFFNEDQFSALVSMAYNTGSAAVEKTIPRIFNKTHEEIIAAFCKYNKGRINGELRELRGLTFRRTTEATLFSTGILKFFN
jgi:GH24 family phage-related lysozyme (muramidase)